MYIDKMPYRYSLRAETIFSKCFFSVSSSSGVNIGGSVAMLLKENKDVEECLRFILITEEVLDATEGEDISDMPKHVALLFRQFSMSMFSSFLSMCVCMLMFVKQDLCVGCFFTVIHVC